MADADAIRAFLLSLQEKLGGFIPFDRFMREALYHPEFGYYSRRIRGLGAGGDFATSATLSEELGRAIWQWSRGSRCLGEVGAGDGSLAHAILRAAGWRRFWIDYRVHEISQPLREVQQKRLGRRINWLPDLTDLRGTVFANELLDAFPCRQFERTELGWREVTLRLEGSLLFESLRECELPQSSVFSAAEWPIGQRVEVAESVRAWLQKIASVSAIQRLLLIDYGGEPEEIYHRRTQGSVRAYWKHQRFIGKEIYARFGQQDLTADVNFRDVRTWAKSAGFQIEFAGSQSEFLTRHLGNSGGEESQHFRVLALRCP